MDIIEVVAQVRELLRQQGRLSYRIVCRQFALDEAALEDLKFELIDIQEVAADKDGKMLVWKGGHDAAGQGSSAPASAPAPASYTPPHLNRTTQHSYTQAASCERSSCEISAARSASTAAVTSGV